jgi:hypothetical protein
MFEKISQIAELAATGVSRREFLGRLGRGAAAAAAATAGILAHPGEALARRVKARCCYYRCGGRGGTSGRYICRADGGACPGLHGCSFRSQKLVSSCTRCGSR